MTTGEALLAGWVILVLALAVLAGLALRARQDARRTRRRSRPE